MDIFVNTTTRECCVNSAAGTVLATYQFESRRSLCFGFSQAKRKLTGRIILSVIGAGAYHVCHDWAEVREVLLAMYNANPVVVGEVL